MEAIFAGFYLYLSDRLEKPVDRILPRWVTPNMVTLFRTVLAAPILACLILGLTNIAFGIYIFAAVLDFVDGLLARARKLVSEKGKFLDAIMDKVFLMVLSMPISAIIFTNSGSDFGLASSMLFILIVLHVSLETVIGAKRIDDFWRSYVEQRTVDGHKIELAANNSGKFKLVLQSVGLGAMILAYPVTESIWLWIADACLITALPFGIRSFIYKIKQS